MIIRIQASGASFLGAGKYYLHDKLDAERAERAQRDGFIGRAEQTDERVWFTDTRNCLNSDPECEPACNFDPCIGVIGVEL